MTMAAQPRECVKCHIFGQIHSRRMCRKCYRQIPELKENARLTRKRYDKEQRRLGRRRRRPKAECVKCHIFGEIWGYGMCCICCRIKNQKSKKRRDFIIDDQKSKKRRGFMLNVLNRSQKSKNVEEFSVN